MQTVNELRPAIGQTVLVRFESVRVSCTILDAKSAYGRARFLVSPVGTASSNSQWVEIDRFARPVSPGLLARRAEAMRQGDSAAIGEIESQVLLEGKR
jgi:hypothetical protein